MRQLAVWAGAIIAVVMSNVAGASPIFDFSTGDAGSSSGIFLVSGTVASGSTIVIDALTVSADPGYDGVYDVIGSIDGSLETGVGNLNFDESLNTITIVGGVTCAGLSAPTIACTQTDINNAKVLVPLGTTLLQATGAFSNVVNTCPGGVPCNATAAFTAPNTEDSSLLTTLGIASNQWYLSASFLAPGTGNLFPVTNTYIVNTAVTVEPASILLVGIVLLGIMHLPRRRIKGNSRLADVRQRLRAPGPVRRRHVAFSS